MLTCSQFLSLDSMLQTHVLWMDGVFLQLRRKAGNIRVELFSLFNFYVEIFYDQFTEEPIYMDAFTDTDQLEPYLQQIGIDELVH